MAVENVEKYTVRENGAVSEEDCSVIDWLWISEGLFAAYLK